jgi:meso-butanediol dehydrogenase/(S,S)-butanediol dehydrogenase/diacetyl reductase
MRMELRGRAALVTGAARGIGRGIALALADAGADVALADLAEGGGAPLTYGLAGRAALEAAAKEVEQRGAAARGAGARALAVTCDVRRAADAEAAVARTLEAFGRLDLLVNNAGVVHFEALAKFPEERWDLLFDVNVKGVFLMSRAAIPALAAAKGAIVNVASVAGKRGYAGGTGYCASKFAVVGLTQALAMELAGQDVRVNAVCPGILPTHMWTDHLASEERGGKAAYEAAIARMIPLGREQTPADVAEAVLYLACARNVTGVSLDVAGGMEVW